jgi:hypothetical protein
MVALLVLTAASIAVGGAVATYKDNTNPQR